MDNILIEVDMDDGYELSINSDEICRNCLTQNCELKSLLRSDIIDGEIHSIPKVYQDVTNIAVVEGDIFPKNICTKCETTLFEAFIFKQKSAKSHKLLKKILHATDDESHHIEFQTERKSQSTQTQPDDEEIDDTATPEVIHHKVEVQEYKIELGCAAECTEVESAEIESAEVEMIEVNDENWQSDFELNAEENRNNVDAIDEIEEFEFVESLVEDDEIYPKSVVDCQHCSQKVPRRQQQSHAKLHTKMLPYILHSVDFFRCNRCQMVFLLMDSFIEHLNNDNVCEELVHSSDDVCIDYQYLNNDLPIRLLSASKNFDENIVSCGQCYLDFEDLAMYQSHIQETHSTDFECNPEYLRANSAHLCGNCNISFKTLHDAIHHVYFHQPTFECLQEDCTQVFNSFVGLCSHFSSEHPDSLFECSHCSYLATDKEDLKRHLRNTCTARNLKCDFCDKKFFNKSTLNMHLRTHTNDRKYPCTKCPKAFLQSNDLANHMRTHTLERPYECFQCDKRFKTIGQRIGHMSTHTTENNFQCDICQKSFKSARILRGHKRIHAERQFICEICEKKFNRRYHLTLHMKRHEKTSAKYKKYAKN